MKYYFILVFFILSLFSSANAVSDTAREHVDFHLTSVKLLKNTWGEDNAQLKLFVISENANDKKTKLSIPADGVISAPLNKNIDIEYNYSGLSVPVTSSSTNFYIIAINDDDGSVMASLAIAAISRVAEAKSVKFLQKFVKRNFYSWAASEAVGYGTEKGLEYAMKYLEENEIGRIAITVTKGKTWETNKTLTNLDNTIQISYKTESNSDEQLVSYKVKTDNNNFKEGYYIELLNTHNESDAIKIINKYKRSEYYSATITENTKNIELINSPRYFKSLDGGYYNIVLGPFKKDEIAIMHNATDTMLKNMYKKNDAIIDILNKSTSIIYIEKN